MATKAKREREAWGDFIKNRPTPQPAVQHPGGLFHQQTKDASATTRILAIDASINGMGWAALASNNVKFGTIGWRCEADRTIAPALDRYAAWLAKSITRLVPDVVAYERPFIHPKRSFNETDGWLQFLLYYTELCCHRFAEEHPGTCAWQLTSPAELKKWATGNGNAKKHTMVATAQQLGHKVTDHNAADAILLLEMQRSRMTWAA